MLNKKHKVAHTSKSQVGFGDYYGSGVKNKVGTTREELTMEPVKTIKKPPKSLA